MKRIWLFAIFSLPLLAGLAAVRAETEEPTEVLATSPSGALRITTTSSTAASEEEEGASEVWVLSTKDPTQKARVPKQSADSPIDDEFHFSPDERWLFGLRHVGSGLRYGNIYQLSEPLRIEVVGQGGSNDLIWENGVRLGALKKDFSAAGFYAMTSFASWSYDSSRLLIMLRGGEEKRNMASGYVYYNTRTNKFEATDYLRKLNKTKSELLACAESVDALPGEAELKAKFEELDRRLNKKYAEGLSKVDKDRVALVREGQRKWIKDRDAGEKFYVAQFPAAEQPRRRLQFLAAATAARLDTPVDQWE
ncbi:MAG: lysozyme inhibitor LprI family protein [Chthoniobacterales bacterium]